MIPSARKLRRYPPANESGIVPSLRLAPIIDTLPITYTSSLMKLLLPLLLLGTWPAHSQTTSPAPTPLTAALPSGKVCLEPHQAEVIQAALTRFELLKQAYVAKSGAYQGLLAGHVQDSLLLVSHGHLLTWYRATYHQEQQLHLETTRRLCVSQQRATRRGLLATGEAALLAFVAYRLLSK